MQTALIAAAGLAGAAQAQVFFTEIMYNLAGSESAATEWVEIYNAGGSAVDLSGWVFADTQDNQVASAFAAGTMLGAGQAAIITQQDAAVFAQIWGAGIEVINVSSFPSLANGASATNETIALFDAAGSLIDEVNYQNNSGGWPNDTGSASIYLLPTALSGSLNDIGANWANSVDGVDGAYTSFIPNPGIGNATGLDVASPGVVPAPGVFALAGVGGLLAARRRR